MKIENLEIKDIEQNENSRVVYKTSDLSELMHSLKRDGQLQPIGVRKMPGGKYDVIFGNRRLMAAAKLGWTTIDAHVMEVETDKERDILNLLENLKRQNTTVAEDGRMFCVLRDYGLSMKEIAERLDISIERVETAIDVHSELPKEYHAKIVNRTSGKKISGTISASAAHSIMGLRRKHQLNRKQTRALLDYAKQDDTSSMHLHKIAPLIKSGHGVESAIRIASKLRRVSLYLFFDEKSVQKLERKHGKSIAELILAQLRKNPEFVIYEDDNERYSAKSRQHRSGAAKAILAG